MKNKGDHYEYIATYVDDLLVFSKDPMKIIDEIKKEYDLKGVGKPEYYLGGNFHIAKDVDSIKIVDYDNKEHRLSPKWSKEGITMAFSAQTYITQSTEKLEQMMGREFSTYHSPMAEASHPELDDIPLANAEEHTKFRSLVGCANWLVTLGRFNIAYAVNAFSRFSHCPNIGHIEGMIRVFRYLKNGLGA